MRKGNLWLVSVLVAFGLAVMAPSLFAVTGVVFSGSNNTNYFIRNEGDAEGVGTISLGTTSTGTVKAGSAFYVTYNVPLAHAGTAYAVGISCTGDFGAAVCASITPFTIGTYAFHSTPNSYPPIGTLSNNQVILTFANDVVLGTPVTGTQINIAVRVMAQGLPYNFPVAATVRAYYQFAQYPMTVDPLYDAAYIVAQVGPSQALTLSIKKGPPTVLTCIGVKDINYYDDEFDLRVAENWNNALTSLSDEYFLENDTIVPAPTNGSNLLFTFSDIPPGLELETRPPYSCAEYPSGPHGCPGGTLAFGPWNSSGVTAGSNSLGVQTFEFPIASSNTAVVENGVFHFRLYPSGPLPPNQNYQIVVTLSLSPLDAPAMPYFTTPEQPTNLGVVNFQDCVTNLLFPYVNTYKGSSSKAFSNFGTGIDFANTTWDPWQITDANNNYIYPQGIGRAIPQSGSCAVYFYPADASATQVYTTPNIAAGASFAFDVGTSVPGFQGQTGYAIAICNFQNAHGFAEIYDNYGIGDPTATLAYLPEIIPNPAFYRRSPAGDGLGEGAIAPVNIHWVWQYILGCGPSLCMDIGGSDNIVF